MITVNSLRVVDYEHDAPNTKEGYRKSYRNGKRMLIKGILYAVSMEIKLSYRFYFTDALTTKTIFAP